MSLVGFRLMSSCEGGSWSWSWVAFRLTCGLKAPHRWKRCCHCLLGILAGLWVSFSCWQHAARPWSTDRLHIFISCHVMSLPWTVGSRFWIQRTGTVQCAKRLKVLRHRAAKSFSYPEGMARIVCIVYSWYRFELARWSNPEVAKPSQAQRSFSPLWSMWIGMQVHEFKTSGSGGTVEGSGQHWLMACESRKA